MDKTLRWFIGITLAVLGIIFFEGSFLATTRIFGIVKATLIRVVFTIPLSWLVIFLFANTKANARVSGWFEKKQAHLSRRARIAVEGGKFLVIVNTAIFLGPVLASILMLMIGIKGKRVYFYAVLCALLCAWLWACFYGGVCWSFDKIVQSVWR